MQVQKKLRKHAIKMRSVSALLLGAIVSVAIVYTTRTFLIHHAMDRYSNRLRQ